MRAFDIREMIESKSPDYFARKPKIVANIIIRTLDYFFQTDEINKFMEEHNQKRGLEFIDAIFKRLDFRFKYSEEALKHVPREGRLLIVANHPLGALDALAIFKIVNQIRSDVKIVVYDIFLKFKNLNEIFLPFDPYAPESQKKEFLGIQNSLENDEAVIIFPAGQVSRMTWRGIEDIAWKKGSVNFARELRVPVLPIYVEARHSLLFYLAGMISLNLSSFMLAHQSIKIESRTIELKIGELINESVFSNSQKRGKRDIQIVEKTYIPSP